MKLNTIVTLTLIAIMIFVCFPFLIKEKEDLAEVLNITLKRNNLIPRENVYYIVDEKTHTIRMVDKPKNQIK